MIPRWYQENAIKSAFSFTGYEKGIHPLIVLPTGSGKSLVIAEIIKRTLEAWPDQRVLVLTHRKELVAQNEEELLEVWPEAPAGVFSAGLKRREVKRITFAGIQSVYRTPEFFTHFNLIIVDEAHLIPDKGMGMYRRFLKELDVPVIGLTATPFRMGQGRLTDGDDSLFGEIIYDISQGSSFVKLIDEGYLANLETKRTGTKVDVSSARIRAGEFVPDDLREAVDRAEVTNAAIDEIVRQGKKRKHWLIFAIDTTHADHIGERLTALGVSNAAVHTKMDGDRSIVLEQFKEGKIRAVVNVNVLTTGFNHRGIDLIALLRPTASASLHIQMLGRGMRVHPNKPEGCLVLDFAGNTERLGPINDVRIGPKRKGDKQGEPITKVCETCDGIVPIATRVCPQCGTPFEMKEQGATKLTNTASSAVVVERTFEQMSHWHAVSSIFYYRHKKKNKPDSLKVVYRCGLNVFNEWVCFEHRGSARTMAEIWWRRRSQLPIPNTINEALARSVSLLQPQEICVNNDKFKTVTSYRFRDSATAPLVRRTTPKTGELHRMSKLRE